MRTHSDLSDGSSESDGNILEHDQPQQHHNIYMLYNGEVRKSLCEHQPGTRHFYCEVDGT